MSARSHFRGWSTVWTSGEYWTYADNGERLPATGGVIRPCKKCNKIFPLGEGEVDPCLGILPGVDNACCGHGIREASYIRFTNGVVVREFLLDNDEKESNF
jgi:hypothetical protein